MENYPEKRMAYLEQRVIVIGHAVSVLLVLGIGGLIYIILRPSSWAWLGAIVGGLFFAWAYVNRPMKEIDEQCAKDDEQGAI